MKQNAKRRGVEFKLSFDDFMDFCSKTKYLEFKGKNPDSLTIDRIDSSKGYEKGNLRVLAHRTNSLRDHYGYLMKMQREGIDINNETKVIEHLDKEINIFEQGDDSVSDQAPF